MPSTELLSLVKRRYESCQSYSDSVYIVAPSHFEPSEAKWKTFLQRPTHFLFHMTDSVFGQPGSRWALKNHETIISQFDKTPDESSQPRSPLPGTTPNRVNHRNVDAALVRLLPDQIPFDALRLLMPSATVCSSLFDNPSSFADVECHEEAQYIVVVSKPWIPHSQISSGYKPSPLTTTVWINQSSLSLEKVRLDFASEKPTSHSRFLEVIYEKVEFDCPIDPKEFEAPT